jgi:hypothetical protein
MTELAGFLRAWAENLPGSVTNLTRDPDDPYDPDEDAPFNIIDEETK